VVHVLTPGRFSRRTAGWASGMLSTSLCVLATAIGTVVVFGEPAVAESVAAIETVTSRLVQPLEAVPPASIVQTPRRATWAPQRAARTIASAAVHSAARTVETASTGAASPIASRNDQDEPVSGAVQADGAPVSVNPPENVAAAPTEPAPQATAPATPGVRHDPTVSDAAVAAAGAATDAWNATAGAAAESGVAVGRKTQKGAVATAGAFARWGRRIASSF
jgi:hypothetical protein